MTVYSKVFRERAVKLKYILDGRSLYKLTEVDHTDLFAADAAYEKEKGRRALLLSKSA